MIKCHVGNIKYCWASTSSFVANFTSCVKSLFDASLFQMLFKCLHNLSDFPKVACFIKMQLWQVAITVDLLLPSRQIYQPVSFDFHHHQQQILGVAGRLYWFPFCCSSFQYVVISRSITISTCCKLLRIPHYSQFVPLFIQNYRHVLIIRAKLVQLALVCSGVAMLNDCILKIAAFRAVVGEQG